MDRLIDTIPCGFVAFTDDGLIVDANRTFSELLGRDGATLAGLHVEQTLSLASRIFFQTHFFPLLKLHGVAEEIYLTLRASTGEDVPVLTNALRHERDGVMRNACVFMRIRNRQKFEDELLHARKKAEAANEAKDSFLSMMSHELRTPLGAISGYADIMEMGIHGPLTDAQLEDLRRIRAASDYLLGLINEILNFSRLEAGYTDLKLEPVPVVAAIERAESLVSLRIAETGLTYDRSPCDLDLIVRADADRLQQVLINLLTNAAKFTPPGGRITVSCEATEKQVRVAVSDTGRGIPATDIHRIFEPFVQVDRDPAHKGLGLGLAISRELARAMGGDLTAQSEYGAGATFVLTLGRVQVGEPSGIEERTI
jgi:signal transduction histidine kinase